MNYSFQEHLCKSQHFIILHVRSNWIQFPFQQCKFFTKMTSLCKPGLISILAAVQYISSATKLQAEIEQKKNCRRLVQTKVGNLAITQTHADLGLRFDLHSHGLGLTHSDSNLKQVQMSGLIITSWPFYDYRQLMMQ